MSSTSVRAITYTCSVGFGRHCPRKRLERVRFYLLSGWPCGGFPFDDQGLPVSACSDTLGTASGTLLESGAGREDPAPGTLGTRRR